MKWLAKKLRGNQVFAKVDDKGELVTGNDGRIEIIYKRAAGAKVYRAAARNLETVESAAVFDFDIGEPVVAGAKQTSGDPIIIYTDGACSGNPGPMGIGAVVMDGAKRDEISEYLGVGTNNIAELTAILRALQKLDGDARTRPVRVHTDSTYAIGLLTRNWKAKANKELVSELRALAATFPGLTMIKVKGHAGVPENERADQLAVEGARAGSGS